MIAYKLFSLKKDGSIGPLFINRKLRLETGKWYPAEAHKTRGFDKKLFKENDLRAREKVKEILSGYKIVDCPNKFATDLFCYDMNSNLSFMVECEVKLVWDTDYFPYKTVNIPSRKEKNFNTNTLTYMYMFNKDLTSVIIIDNKTIMDSKMCEQPNKYVSNGEMFFKVPIDKVIIKRLS